MDGSSYYTISVSDDNSPSSLCTVAGPYWNTTGTVTVDWTASDNIDLASVDLWYRYSPNNDTGWTVGWTTAGYSSAASGTSDSGSWSVNLTALEGEGLYEFSTTAYDASGNEEADPSGAGDDHVGYDVTDPSSTCTVTGSPWNTTGNVTIDWTASDNVNLSSSSIELWYRYKPDDNASTSWSTWIDLGATYSSPTSGTSASGSWDVDLIALDGVGLYDFCTKLSDDSGNAETDPAGTVSGPREDSVGYDTIDPSSPPRSWLTVTLDPDGYIVSASTFHIRGADNVGMWKIFYKIDDGVLHEGGWRKEVQFQINELHGYEPGAHTIEYWAEDPVGNEETPHHVETYVLDTDGPDTTLSFDGVAEVTAGQVWQVTADTSVVLSASDDELGVDSIHYRVDDGDWTSYSEPFTVEEPGRHTLYYYAKDVMGNFGDMGSVVVDVGAGSPSSSCSVTPDRPTGDNGWYTTGVTVELSATDEASGVSHVMYRVDGGDWQRYDGSFAVDGDGRHDIDYYAVDNAGREEAVNTRRVKIDLYGPDVAFERPRGALYLFGRPVVPLPGNQTVVVGPVTIRATVVDTATSGVASTELYIDDERCGSFDSDVTYPVDTRMLGRHRIRVVAYDRAGNRATATVAPYILSLGLRET